MVFSLANRPVLAQSLTLRDTVDAVSTGIRLIEVARSFSRERPRDAQAAIATRVDELDQRSAEAFADLRRRFETVRDIRSDQAAILRAATLSATDIQAISQQSRQILATQTRVVEELARIPGIIDAALDRHTFQNQVNDVIAIAASLQVNVAPLGPSPEKQQLLGQLYSAIIILTQRLGQHRDVSAFPSYATAISLQLIIGSMWQQNGSAAFNAASVRSIANDAHRTINRWVPGGLSDDDFVIARQNARVPQHYKMYDYVYKLDTDSGQQWITVDVYYEYRPDFGFLALGFMSLFANQVERQSDSRSLEQWLREVIPEDPMKERMISDHLALPRGRVLAFRNEARLLQAAQAARPARALSTDKLFVDTEDGALLMKYVDLFVLVEWKRIGRLVQTGVHASQNTLPSRFRGSGELIGYLASPEISAQQKFRGLHVQPERRFEGTLARSGWFGFGPRTAPVWGADGNEVLDHQEKRFNDFFSPHELKLRIEPIFRQLRAAAASVEALGRR